MKNLKLYVILALLGLGGVTVANAASEAGFTDGNLSFTQIGDAQIGTGTLTVPALHESRRIRVTPAGFLRTVQGVSQSSYSEVATSTNAQTINVVLSTSNSLYNPNCLAVGLSSAPIYLDKIKVGALLSGGNNARVQVFDSRGSTNTGKLFDAFITSNTTTDLRFEMWLSSGLTVKHDGGMSFLTMWEEHFVK